MLLASQWRWRSWAEGEGDCIPKRGRNGKGTMGRQGQGRNGRARARAQREGAMGGCNGRAGARAQWEGDSRMGRRWQQSVASQNEGEGKGDDVSHKKIECRRRENMRDAPEFEHVTDGLSTRTENSCWPHRPARKSHFSAFNAFSKKKKHHLWKKKNRSGHDKALRVTKGARELCRQLQRW